MSKPPEPLFLAKQSYRRRRFADAARLLPLLGVILLFLPVMWAGTGSTGGGLIYLFVVWAGLIAVVGYVSHRLADRVHGDDTELDDQPGSIEE